MIGRALRGWALWVLGALSVTSCTGDAYMGACGRPEGCAAQLDGGSGDGGGGITCSDGVCSCSTPGEVPCCPSGGSDCATSVMECRSESACAALKDECVFDEDCPGPPDYRCGVPRCDEGKCDLEIWGGKQIANQFPGDCKVNTCTFKGELEVWPDPSDLPDDGNPCTSDTCEGDVPANTNLPDKTPCPDASHGICDDGKYWECSTPLSVDCPKIEEFCYWNECVTTQCSNWEKDGQEIDVDCGAPGCHKCLTNFKCFGNGDCADGVCKEGKCAAPTHSDGVKNGDETGVDCGYPGGPPNVCKDGEGCRTSADCVSLVCYQGVCQSPTCIDATKNGMETEPDCGGGCSPCQN